MIRYIRPIALTAILGFVVGCGSSQSAAPLERGQSLLRKGDYAEAIVALDEAVRLDPRSPDAHVFRGRAYQCREQAGDLDAAIEDFNTAIELDPNSYEAFYSRSIALRDRGKATGSEADARRSAADRERARQLDPELADSLKRTPIDSNPMPSSTSSHAGAEDIADSETTDTIDDNPTDRSVTTDLPEEEESTADVIRRLEAEAAAAGQGRPGGQNEESKLRSELRRDVPLDYDQSPAEKPQRPRESSRSRRLRRDRERRLAEQAQSAAARRMQVPLSNAPGGLPADSQLDSRGGSAISGIPPLTPAQGNLATSPSGGTLPPVANPPFSTQGPLTTPALPGGQQPSGYQTPYQSPFPQRAPRPTGYVQPRFPTTPAGTQPQSFYTPSPQQVNPMSPTLNRPATNRSPTVRRDGYLFP